VSWALRANPDPSLRELERRWLSTGAPDDGAAYVHAAMRQTGRDLQVEALDEWAQLRHRGALPRNVARNAEVVQASLNRIALRAMHLALRILPTRPPNSPIPHVDLFMTWPWGALARQRARSGLYVALIGSPPVPPPMGSRSGPAPGSLVLGLARAPYVIGATGAPLVEMGWPELFRVAGMDAWYREQWFLEAPEREPMPGVEWLSRNRVRVPALVAARWSGWRLARAERWPS
jgi:hypothetical protein